MRFHYKPTKQISNVMSNTTADITGFSVVVRMPQGFTLIKLSTESTVQPVSIQATKW